MIGAVSDRSTVATPIRRGMRASRRLRLQGGLILLALEKMFKHYRADSGAAPTTDVKVGE